MDRRSWLKSVFGGAAVATAAAVSLPAPAKQAREEKDQYASPDRAKLVKDTADEVEAYLAHGRKLSPEFPRVQAISLPFACLPVNVYVRTDDAVARTAPPCPNLQELCTMVRRGKCRRGMADVMKEVWNRCKPAWHEVRDYPSKPEMRRSYEDAKAKKHPALLSDRVMTPRFTVDLADLDFGGLAVILASPRLVREELDRKTKLCRDNMIELQKTTGVFPIEGDGWMSPLDVYTDDQEHEARKSPKDADPGISISRMHYILEVFCGVVSGGVIYPINDRYFKGPDAAENAAWLEERRKDPSHWHVLLDPTEVKA